MCFLLSVSCSIIFLLFLLLLLLLLLRSKLSDELRELATARHEVRVCAFLGDGAVLDTVDVVNLGEEV